MNGITCIECSQPRPGVDPVFGICPACADELMRSTLFYYSDGVREPSDKEVVAWWQDIGEAGA